MFANLSPTQLRQKSTCNMPRRHTEEVEVYLYSSLTSALNGWLGGVVGVKENISPPRGFEPLPVHPVKNSLHLYKYTRNIQGSMLRDVIDKSTQNILQHSSWYRTCGDLNTGKISVGQSTTTK
jgi:hypothetical protein